MKRKFRFNFNIALFLILVALFAGIALLNPVFLSFDYLIGVMLRNIVEIGMMSLTMTMIVVTGGIDLSVGSTMVLASMLGGMAALKFGGAAGALVTMLVGAACGLFNGLLIAKVKISPLVTTLATMYLYIGLARSFSHGDSVYAYDLSQWLGTTNVAGVPVQILYFAALALFSGSCCTAPRWAARSTASASTKTPPVSAASIPIGSRCASTSSAALYAPSRG